MSDCQSLYMSARDCECTHTAPVEKRFSRFNTSQHHVHVAVYNPFFLHIIHSLFSKLISSEHQTFLAYYM